MRQSLRTEQKGSAPNSVASGKINTFDAYQGKVGKGNVFYFAGNLDPKDAASIIQQSKDTVALLMNSPTFAAAFNAMLNSPNGIVINPVEFSGGGTVAGNNIVFGTLAGQWDNGAILYAAYTMAHEFGHTFQGSDLGNSAWNLDSRLQSVSVARGAFLTRS